MTDGCFFERWLSLIEGSIEKKKEAKTFTEFLRSTFGWVLVPIVRFLDRVGVKPNMLTLAGFIGTLYSAYLFSQGQFSWGGLVYLVSGPIDALDGALARLQGEAEDFGAFVDSVTDRYSELFVFAGLLWYSLQNGDSWLAMATYLAAFGSVLVSYTRARAQSLGLEAKVGLFSRVERIIVLGPLMLFNLPYWGVGLIAVGANLTALQRVLHVRNLAHNPLAKGKSSN